MAVKKRSTFPLLNTDEAEEIVRELGKALDVHGEWIGQFRAMLVCRTKPQASDLKNDSHKQTVFGRWYFGNVNPHLRDHPDFATVGKHNEQMHDLARILARCVLNDDAIEPDDYKAFVGCVARFRVSVRRLLSEAWDFLRFTDPLTGVMTRTAMQSRLDEERARVRRDDQPCSVGMMDLDHFKGVNDTHGHQAGDQVLQTVAAYVREHLRRYDQVFRYGGEEFLLLFPNTTASGAKTVLDRLRQGIKRQKIKIGGRKSLHVSASFGVAELLPDVSVDASIELADQALYEAKEAGRNRVHVWKVPDEQTSK
jgi:diguanylate cyclase